MKTLCAGAGFEQQPQMKLRLYHGIAKAGSKNLFWVSSQYIYQHLVRKNFDQLILSFWSNFNLFVSHFKMVTMYFQILTSSIKLFEIANKLWLIVHPGNDTYYLHTLVSLIIMQQILFFFWNCPSYMPLCHPTCLFIFEDFSYLHIYWAFTYFRKILDSEI